MDAKRWVSCGTPNCKVKVPPQRLLLQYCTVLFYSHLFHSILFYFILRYASFLLVLTLEAQTGVLKPLKQAYSRGSRPEGVRGLGVRVLGSGYWAQIYTTPVLPDYCTTYKQANARDSNKEPARSCSIPSHLPHDLNLQKQAPPKLHFI